MKDIQLENTKDSEAHSNSNINETSMFEKTMERYIQLINTQDKSLPVIARILIANAKTWYDNLMEFLRVNNIEKVKNEDGSVRLSIPVNKAAKFQKLLKEQGSSFDTVNIAISNIVVAIVSQYDAYLGELVRILFKISPSLLDVSNKQFPAEQIFSYESIDEFRNSLIEKELETVLRWSHTKQIEWLEKKLGIPLTKDLKIYPSFVEITERRNLLVHANGRVSKQYISECKQHGVKEIDKIREGCVLTCNSDYAQMCYSVFFEMGIKLGLVLWHKLLPSESEKLYGFIDPVCFNLIREKKYDLALNLLDFMLTPSFKKDCPYAYKLVFTINKALIFQLKGDKQKASSIVTKLDCSAAEEIYRMAVYILQDDFDSALSSMRKIGKASTMRNAYREWPLFTSIRDSEEFKKIYKEIFEEEYQYDEIPSTDFDKLMRNAMDIHKHDCHDYEKKPDKENKDS